MAYPVPPPLRKSRLREQDDTDTKIEPEPEEFQGMEFQVPVRRARTTGGAPIPVRVQKAAETLLGYSELKQSVKREMQILFDRPDDSAVIDPLIVISKTVSTGTCSIFLEEEVPVSQLLLARVLNARFVVQVTQKASMPPENFEEVAVKASRSGGGIRARAQPFYVADCLESVVQRIAEDDDVENLLYQIRAYMWSLGPISSREASDFDFLETHAEAFRQIRSGKLVPVKERPSLKDKLHGASTTKKKQRFARADEDE